MRHAVLLSFFICLYFHFKSSPSDTQQSDTLSTVQASVTKVDPKPASLPSFKAVKENHSQKAIQKSDESVAINEIHQDYDQDDLSQLPWDDIEEGWKSQLKDFLASADPENANDIFTAYLEAKKKYVERIDFSDQESAPDALIEQDGEQGEADRLHTENLKDIFGEHYSQVESLHRDYVDSVQYLNRTSVKFSISL